MSRRKAITWKMAGRGTPYQRFFEIWAAKESYVKYTGQGIDGGFGKFSTAPEAGNIIRSRLPWTAEGVWFWKEDVGERLRALRVHQKTERDPGKSGSRTERKSMKLLKPDFYDGFACIASRCRDTCCAGWEIEVDEETLKKYREVPGNFGRLLRSRISEEEDGAYFALAPGRRCPFLNERNLCEIYLQLGEDMLCDICREHPRFYQWFGDYTEAGLGICCEEVCRLLFQRKEPLRFVLEEQGNGAEEEDPLLKPLLAARERLFSILQNRTYPMDQRMAGCPEVRGTPGSAGETGGYRRDPETGRNGSGELAEGCRNREKLVRLPAGDPGTSGDIPGSGIPGRHLGRTHGKPYGAAA